MRHYLKNHQTVVYEDVMRRHRWLITPQVGGSVQVYIGNASDFREQLRQLSTMYIYDDGGADSVPQTVQAFTIVLSSSDKMHYRS